jgi:UDP-arabinose 4-epimerase
MPRTLFATGSAGYVGSHCCKAFALAGWRVVTFDNLSTGWPDFVRWGPFIQGDVLDQSLLTMALKHVQPDAVIHFAARSYVAESIERPAGYLRNNVVGTLNLLDAMRAAGVNQILFSSSCATYGVPAALPIDETCPQQPISPYGRSKLMSEKMLGDYDAAYGLRHVVLRYFNAAGADPDGDIGERHVPETHLIPLALQAALTGEPVRINGTDFETPDGTAIRDYVHVTDLADAHCRALDYLLQGGSSSAFNLGTGAGFTVAEILAAVEQMCGKSIRREIGRRRCGDPPALVASAKKARAVLGWEPLLSDLEDIVRTAWRWHTQAQEAVRPFELRPTGVACR